MSSSQTLSISPTFSVARLRSWTFDAALAAWTASFIPVIPALWLCGTPPRAVRRVTRVWAQGIMVLLALIIGLHFREHGRALIPHGPCLIICNHQSTWETLAALVLFPDVAIVAKQELLRIPVLGWFLRRSPMIIIDREGGTAELRKMMTFGTAALAQNRPVLIFPEGTRKSLGDRIEFKRGVELLYKALGVPVLPVVINSGRFWDLDTGRKRAGTIDVAYLAPIEPHLGLADFARRGQAVMQAEMTRQAGLVGI